MQMIVTAHSCYTARYYGIYGSRNRPNWIHFQTPACLSDPWKLVVGFSPFSTSGSLASCQFQAKMWETLEISSPTPLDSSPCNAPPAATGEAPSCVPTTGSTVAYRSPTPLRRQALLPPRSPPKQPASRPQDRRRRQVPHSVHRSWWHAAVVQTIDNVLLTPELFDGTRDGTVALACQWHPLRRHPLPRLAKKEGQVIVTLPVRASLRVTQLVPSWHTKRRGRDRH
jgi:hypothetical protein